MAKALIDPHTGHRWVKPDRRKKWYVRKLFRHTHGLCMRMPKEVVEQLHLDHETYVMLKWEPAGLVFSVLTVEKGKQEKEGA
jgi:hypothetical protein